MEFNVKEVSKLKHAFVIGGTGMLAEVSLWLVNQGYIVTVVGRNEEKMKALMKKDELNIVPLLVDYHDTNQFRNCIRQTIAQNGPIDLVVAWIHSIGDDVLRILSSEISNNWQLFHVLGSRANLPYIKNIVQLSPNCMYFQIQLGFIIEANHSRWLTHQEISAGVIDAIKKKENTLIVGVLEPVEKRP